MEIEFVFKIAAAGIIISLLNTVLSRMGREEQAMLTTLAGLTVVLAMVAREISSLFSYIRQLFGL